MKTSHILIALGVGGVAYYMYNQANPPPSKPPTSSALGTLGSYASAAWGKVSSLFGAGAPPASASSSGGVLSFLSGGLLDANTAAWSSQGDAAQSDAMGLAKTSGRNLQPQQNDASDPYSTPSNLPSSLDDLAGGSSFTLS